MLRSSILIGGSKASGIYYSDAMRVARSLPISGDFGRFGRDSPIPLSAAVFVKYAITGIIIICKKNCLDFYLPILCAESFVFL